QMPKRTDINKILIIGSGPIIIGQACEFDYSGTQACRSLQDEGYEVVLINSNPATIFTDPMMADEIYLMLLTKDSIKGIVAKENSDSVMLSIGGQRGLNITLDLKQENCWEENNIDIIVVDMDAVEITEYRQHFRYLMEKIDIPQCRSRMADSLL